MRITESISPERASYLLATSSNESPIDKNKVNNYKKKMVDGRWIEDNGFFINIRRGRLMNGRHRLLALIESGLTLNMRIQYDL